MLGHLNSSFAQMSGYLKKGLLVNKMTEPLIQHNYHDVIAENIKRGIEPDYSAEGIKKDGSIFLIIIKGKTVSTNHRNITRIATLIDQSNNQDW